MRWIQIPGARAVPWRAGGSSLWALGLALIVVGCCGAGSPDGALPAPRGVTATATQPAAAPATKPAATPAQESATLGSGVASRPIASSPSTPPATQRPPTEQELGRFVRLALDCVDRPYPYKPAHVLTGSGDLQLPSDLHPVFYGCFDWHSAVHGHWMLLRVLRRWPQHPLAGRIRTVLGRRLTPAALAAEAGYFRHPQRASFERPYGWAWALRLVAELHGWDDPQARIWRDAVRPLEAEIVRAYKSYLPKLSWPIRAGVHPNTAFALALALDYARTVGDAELEALVVRRSRDYFADDTACPVAYEPSGEDFFSPCLLEADLMRRVLPASELGPWLQRFWPGLGRGELGPLARPATVSDPSDPKIVHLDGLNLVRAWTMRGVAAALPREDPRRGPLTRAAALHAEAGLARIASGFYEGQHWLASFGVYLLTQGAAL